MTTTLPRLNASRINVFGEAGPADEFDHDMNIGVLQHLLRVPVFRDAGNREGFQPGFLLVANPLEIDPHAQPLGNEVGVAAEVFDHPAADDAGADKPDIELFRLTHGRIRGRSVTAGGGFV